MADHTYEEIQYEVCQMKGEPSIENQNCKEIPHQIIWNPHIIASRNHNWNSRL